MQLMDRILLLAKERGIKQNFLNNLIGGYRGKFTEFKKGKSTLTKEEIEIIANYFNVSVDYLIGKTENRNINSPIFNESQQIDNSLNEREKEIINIYQKLDLKGKSRVTTFAYSELERMEHDGDTATAQ